MKSYSVRDLRSKSAEIWKELARLKEIVITSKGRPIGVISSTDESNLEKTLASLRRARAILAVAESQLQSVQKGLNRLSNADIDAEIKAVRKKRSH
ncbi:MAG: type II toxin-antitoxin system prevent-host-death family antitoxin [Elusimicrobiota bacterium]